MNRTALAAAAAVAIVGVALFGLYMKRFEAEARGGEPVRILAITDDVAPGDAVRADILAVRRIPERYVEDRHIRAADHDRILGLRVSSSVEAGSSLLWTDLETAFQNRVEFASLLREGMRAVTVMSDIEGGAFGGLLSPGDRVDLIFTMTRPDGETVTSVLLQNILVLAVGAETADAATRGGNNPNGRKKQVTLAVTPDEGTLIAHAALRGQMQLTLRGIGDHGVIDEPPEANDQRLLDEPPPETRVRHQARMVASPMGPTLVGGAGRR